MQAPNSDAGGGRGSDSKKGAYMHGRKIPQTGDGGFNDTDSINSPRGPYEVQVGLDFSS